MSSLLAQANTGTGTDNLDTDQSKGAGGLDHTTVAKIRNGGAGVDGGLVTTANPFPVSLGSADVNVSVATLPLPSDAATEATLVAIDAEFGNDGASPPSIPGSGVRGWLRSIYDKLASGTLAVAGTVAVSNLGTEGVSPPVIPGTGIVGYLRSMYDNLVSTLTLWGSVSDAAAVSDSANSSIMSHIKRLEQKLPATVGAQGNAVSLSVVDGSREFASSAAGLSVLNTNLLTGIVSGWYDASKEGSLYVQIVASAGISAGALFFEGTNDTTAAPNGQPTPVDEHAVAASSLSRNIITATTIAASTTRIFTVPVRTRYIRVRISTAFVGGTIQAFWSKEQRVYSPSTVVATQNLAANLQTTTTLTASQILGAVNGTSLSALSNATFIASAAITTTTLGTATATAQIATTTVGQWQTVQLGLACTVVTGTSPTMDVVIQESFDNAVTWEDVYHYPRVTAALTKALMSPALTLRGTHLRVNRTVGGTTPSFTNAVLMVTRAVREARAVQFFDRTIAPATLGSATPAWLIEGCSNITAYVSSVSATTPATYQIQVSMDGSLWANVGTATASTATTTVSFSVANTQAKYARIIVTTAGTAQVLNYAGLVAGGS